MPQPIKRNKHIVLLSKDHHLALLFCWKIRQGLQLGVDEERIKKYVQYFWNHHMLEHFREEEEILFAPVQDPMIVKALEDHQKISAMVGSITSGETESMDDFRSLADAVDNHVRFEERELFPQLEMILSEEQLNSIGDQLNEQHPVNNVDDFEDAFWIRPK
jgi:hemerythrin-like domain-containing protein